MFNSRSESYIRLENHAGVCTSLNITFRISSSRQRALQIGKGLHALAKTTAYIRREFPPSEMACFRTTCKLDDAAPISAALVSSLDVAMNT